MTNIFDCKTAVDFDKDGKLEFDESIWDYDCKQTCWEEKHLRFVILVSFALIVYMPLAILCRPMWQELQNEVLHIKQNPSFLFIKMLTQTTVIVLHKVLLPMNESVYRIIFCILMISYTSFMWKKWPVNYDRLNWLFVICMVLVDWMAFLATIANITKT